MVIIREAKPDERAVVGELRVAAYRDQGFLAAESHYTESLRNFGFDGAGDSLVLAAVDEDDSVLGTITLEFFGPNCELARDKGEADIRAFGVSPSAQGRGVGRELLQEVVAESVARGLVTLRLCTQDAMLAAQHLYETAGFTRTPERDWSPVPGLTLRAYALPLGD
jgi:ribosomal protein S18 acetylase RimI-like enzyme